jgi:hypothetical protein
MRDSRCCLQFGRQWSMRYPARYGADCEERYSVGTIGGLMAS